MQKIVWCFWPALLLLASCANKNDSTFQASAIVEGTAIKVAAQTGGYLLKLHVDEGQDVSSGDTLALVDVEKLGYQLDQVQASLDEINVQHRLASTNLRRAQEDYDYAKTKYARYLDLFQKNAASQQALDDLKNAYDRANTALDAAKQGLQAIASKEKGLEAQAKLLQRQINDAMVKAPVSGTITTRFYDAGEPFRRMRRSWSWSIFPKCGRRFMSRKPICRKSRSASPRKSKLTARIKRSKAQWPGSARKPNSRRKIF